MVEVECTECGKKFDVQLYGKVKYREWKVEHTHGFATIARRRRERKKPKSSRKGVKRWSYQNS